MCVDSNYPGGLDVCGYTALGALMCCGYVTQEGHCKNDHILALPELQLILWSVAAVDTTMITLMCEYSKR